MSEASPRTVAITGASGLLGRHLCDHFRRVGWEVRALVRQTSGYPFVEAGICRYRFLLPGHIEQEALRGADVLIHCAYMMRFTNLPEARQVDEEGTRRLLAAAREAGVECFVFVSSTSAHAAAESYYGRSKHALEQIMDPMRDLIVRPGLILAADEGLFHRVAELIRRTGLVPLFWGGRQIVQTVHVDDLCTAFERSLDRDLRGVITVAEPEGLTMQELLRLTAERLGRPYLMLPLPAAPMLTLLRLIERAGVPLPISSENLLGLKSLRHVSTAADLERLGQRVRTARESLASLF